MEWIKCSDRLPEEETNVLLFGDFGIAIDYRTDSRDANIWACTEDEAVSHWMPFPEPPKGEK